MHAAAPDHRRTQALSLDEGHLRSPITTKAPAHDGDALSIDVWSPFQVVNDCAVERICRRRGFDGAFTHAGHIYGASAHSRFLQRFVIFVALGLEGIDTAEINHHRMPTAVARNA